MGPNRDGSRIQLVKHLLLFLIVTVYINLNLPELIYNQYTTPSAREEQLLCKHVDKSLGGHDHCICL